MEISSQYIASEIESKWYQHWMDNGYFHSEPDERSPFSIVIPPPNVTGVLHMGHMLNNTIQDILIRRARQKGLNACWVPGTDHASIATEAKVVKMLREEGVKKSDLTRDEFLNHAWGWKDKYGGIILEQLKKLGASCDWERTAFTMDDTRSEGVIKAFVDLYNKDVLYRGKRMVNWDPQAQTVLSNEEVLYKEVQGNLYHIKYMLEDGSDFLTIATTRPETLLGDSAVAIHPDDERFKHFHGKRVIVPIVNRSVPIIVDDYVDIEFGTGALKVTPAHDINDYDLGKKHNLEVIEIFNDDGSISEAGQFFVGEDRFKARKLVKAQLEEDELLVEVEPYRHNVGRSERTNAVVEPKLSLQWYVNMKMLVDPALEAVESDTVEFFPKNMKNTYRHWMVNIRDWCISRQLWWGQRVPAYYYKDDVFVSESPEGALTKAQQKYPDLKQEDLKQDEDVLDTWFSSWLWPISVFDGFNNSKDIEYYYPTSVLVTGWDIIFLWVARMIIAGYEWKGTFPFKQVYFTGMVRDQKRRKMSKSLGNSPDALALIEKFGADGVRFGMLSCSPAGGDLLFDEKLCEQGRNFTNKIWNALRLVQGWEVESNKTQPIENELAIDWFTSLSNSIIESLDKKFEEYRLSEALIDLYSYVWTDFCSWYLEMVKPPYGEAIDIYTKEKTVELFRCICTLLHPYMPFITEEVWSHLKNETISTDCILSQYPILDVVDPQIITETDIIKSIVSGVRDLRNKHQIKPKEKLTLFGIEDNITNELVQDPKKKAMLTKLSFLDEFEIVDSELENAVSFIAGKSKFFIQLKQEINIEEALAEKEKELKYQEGFIIGVQKKLANERFVQNAPEAVVANEKKKLADGLSRKKNLEQSIEELKSRL